MPAISLPSVASDSQSPSASFTAAPLSPVSSGLSFASVLSGTAISPLKTDSDRGATASSNIEAAAAEVTRTDALNPDLAKIEISTVISVKSYTSESKLTRKIDATLAPSSKKESTDPTPAALAVAALAFPQWTPIVTPQTSVGDVSISAGATGSISDAQVPAVLPHSQTANLAGPDLTAFAQAAGNGSRSPMSSLQFDASLITKTALAPQSLNSYSLSGSKEQPRSASGSDALPQTPAATGAPQDVPLAVPVADPARPLETIPINRATNIAVNVETQTYPQSSVPDSPLPRATDSIPPTVNPEPNTTKSPAMASVFPQMQVVTQVGLPAQPSTGKAATAIGGAPAKPVPGTSNAPAMQIPPDGTNPSSNETRPEPWARAAANSHLPIQTPSSPPALNHSPQTRASIPPSAPVPSSNAHASVLSHTEVFDSKVSPRISEPSTSIASNTKADTSSPSQSADQNSRADKSHVANSAGAKADSSKTNMPAKRAVNDSSLPQNSGLDPKTDSPLPAAATAAAPQGNSQPDSAATNAGPLIAGLQSAANSSSKPDVSPALARTEPTLVNTPQPQPTQLPVSRIFHNPNQSEMHVGFRTESFGAVDVRTTISEKQVQVALGSERGELKGFMALELPALQNNLQQHDLRLQTLRTIVPAYTTQSDVFSGAGGQQDSQRQNDRSRTAIFQRHETARREDEDQWAPRARLSVRI